MGAKPVGVGPHFQTHRTMNALIEYLNEIKKLTEENETLRIKLRHAEHSIGILNAKLKRSEDYNAILAARCDSAGVQED
jgi:hypothetical protein